MRFALRHALITITALMVLLSATLSGQPATTVGALDNETEGPSGVAPSNDDFDNATAIEALPFSDATNTTLATTQSGEPLSACLDFGAGFSSVAATAWYTFTADSDTLVRADTIGSDFPTIVAVFQGTSLEELTLDSCGFPALVPFAEDTQFAFEAAAGETYLLQVGGASSRFAAGPLLQAVLPDRPPTTAESEQPGLAGAGSGSLVLSLSALTVPSCPAETFSIDDPVADTLGSEPPRHDITSVDIGTNAEALCLTVNFDAPVGRFEDGEDDAAIAVVPIDIDANPATGTPNLYDSICLPSGLGVEALAITFPGFGLLVPVASGLFEPEATEVVLEFGTAIYEETAITLVLPLDAVGGDDSLAVTVVAGSPASDSFDCAPNGGSLACDLGICSFVPPPPPPPNDDFADAEVVSSVPFSDSETTTSATTETGEPVPRCAPGEIASTVWYSFTPEEDELFVVDTAGSNFTTVTAIWTESAFGLFEVACGFNFQGLGASLALEAVGSETYFIQVGGAPFDISGGSLSFSISVAVPPENDDFASARTINALPFTDSVVTISATTEPGEPVPGCSFDSLATTVWYSFTPATDTFLVADTMGSTTFEPIVAAYEGPSLDSLNEISCATPNSSLAFEASGGQTYVFQVGSLSFNTSGDSESGEDLQDSESSGGFFGSGKNIVFNLDSFSIPTCPPPQFSVGDPEGDTFGFTTVSDTVPDIVSVSGGSDTNTFCLTVEFAGPIDPPDAQTEQSITATIDFDTDQDINTGFPSDFGYICQEPGPFVPLRPTDLGIETAVRMYGGSPLMIPIEHRFEPGSLFASALFDERSFTLVMPLAAVGGDDSFDFGISVGSFFSGPSDCAPNAGFISSPTGATTLGDASCDSAVDAIDAALILQFSAGLLSNLPCPGGGDVNGDGEVTSIDAALVLQFTAGLLSSLRLSPGAERSVGVSLTEFVVEPSVASISAGTVTFNVSNDGAIFHNLLVVATDLPPDGLPTNDATFTADESRLDVVGSTATLNPGETVELTVDLTVGNYVLICNIPTHYEIGMTVAFRVE